MTYSAPSHGEVCQYCDFRAKDFAEQSEHMMKDHPGVVQKRLEDGGFIRHGLDLGPDQSEIEQAVEKLREVDRDLKP